MWKMTSVLKLWNMVHDFQNLIDDFKKSVEKKVVSGRWTEETAHLMNGQRYRNQEGKVRGWKSSSGLIYSQ